MPQDLGSRRWFQYTADNGTEYAVELDESIYETAALGFGVLAGQRDVILSTSTRPVSMRYLNLVRVDGDNMTERAKVFVGTTAAFAALQGTGTIAIDGEAWGISSVRGESRKLVPQTDTEKLDGDVDDNIVVV